MGLYDILKDGIDIVSKGKNPELYQLLLDAQKETLELNHENSVIKDEIKKLEKYLEKRGRMEYSKAENVYYEVLDNNEKDGPFCPRCWQEKDKTYRLTMPTVGTQLVCTVCTVCDKAVRKEPPAKEESYLII